jgi:ribosome maturation factor RimP
VNIPNTEAIADLLRPALNQVGVELLDVQWKGKGRASILRLVVDRPGGVDLGDCERASLTASAVLDAYDPVAGSYSLEVSSPGAERPLRTPPEWRSAVGRRVNVRYKVGDSERIVEGRLLAVGEASAEIDARLGKRTQPMTVPLADILAARITVDI